MQEALANMGLLATTFAPMMITRLLLSIGSYMPGQLVSGMQVFRDAKLFSDAEIESL